MIFGIFFLSFFIFMGLSHLFDSKKIANIGSFCFLGAFGSSFYEKMPLLMGYVNFKETWEIMSPILIFIGIGLLWIAKISFFILCLFAPAAISIYASSK